MTAPVDAPDRVDPDATAKDTEPEGATPPDDGVTAAVNAKQRKAAAEEGDTYPGTDKFPIATREQARNAVRLYGNSDIPAEKVKAWLKRRLKAKGWEDLIPDSWKSDSVTAAAELLEWHRQAITAAVPALVRDLGIEQAYQTLPAIFQAPGTLEYAGSLIELPLDDEGLTAAATTLPPKEWFEQPGGPMPPGSGHFVDGRRVWGRLAEWDVPHIGVDGRPIFAPRSPSNYHWYHRKGTRVQGPSGVERLKIGHLTFDIGHAPTQGVSWQVASGHYDDSRYRAARVRMYEDEIGPWYAGALCSGIEGDRLERFEESDTSGDWRAVMGGPLDLVAALCVNVGGFPKVGLALAASGEPLALVAAGKRHHAPELGVGDPETFAAAVVAALDAREERAALLAELGQDPEAEQEAEILRLTLTEDDDGEMAELVAALVADAVPSMMPAHLQKSYLTGKVAARIRWNTPGDMTRCMLQAKAHGMGRKAAGACARLHKLATGVWPGDRRNVGRAG